VYRTTIPELSIGHLKLYNIPASINPAMNGSSALLGMSALKWFNLEQQGSELIISQ
jgi:aspartyl protease family protein